MLGEIKENVTAQAREAERVQLAIRSAACAGSKVPAVQAAFCAPEPARMSPPLQPSAVGEIGPVGPVKETTLVSSRMRWPGRARTQAAMDSV